MAVVVVQGDQVVLSKGYGVSDLVSGRKVTAKTRFYNASSTKAFTAFAIASLAQRNKIDLDAQLSFFIPDLTLQPPLDANSISLKQLLTHTHGINSMGPIVFRTAYSGQWDHKLLISLLTSYTPDDNGTEFTYGNIGYNIAGLALKEKFQIDWRHLVQQEIFEPLDMTATTAFISTVEPKDLAMPHQLDKNGEYMLVRLAKSDETMHAAGGLVTTAEDLTKWLIAQVNNGKVNQQSIFSPDLISATHRQQVTQDREFLNYHRYGYTLGWDMATLEGENMLTRFGSFPGYYSHMSLMPDKNIGVAVLVNGATLGGVLAETVASLAYQTLLNRDDVTIESTLARMEQIAGVQKNRFLQDIEKRAQRSQKLVKPVGSYTGTFYNDKYGEMTWSVNDGQLSMSMGSIYIIPVEVYNADKNQFRIDFGGGGTILQFIFDNNKTTVNFLGAEFVPKK